MINEEMAKAAEEAFKNAMEALRTEPPSPEFDELGESEILFNLANVLETLSGVLDAKRDAMILTMLKHRITRILRRDDPESGAQTLG